jgi:hypothetical protein
VFQAKQVTFASADSTFAEEGVSAQHGRVPARESNGRKGEHSQEPQQVLKPSMFGPVSVKPEETCCKCRRRIKDVHVGECTGCEGGNANLFK